MTAAIVVYVLATLTIGITTGEIAFALLWPLVLPVLVGTEIAVAWSNWTYAREQKRAARGGK